MINAYCHLHSFQRHSFTIGTSAVPDGNQGTEADAIEYFTRRHHMPLTSAADVCTLAPSTRIRRDGMHSVSITHPLARM